MTKSTPDLSPLRAQFPALQETDAQGRPFVYFDGPGGTQAPQVVLDSMTNYLTQANANKGGQFITSRRSDEIITEARQSPAEVDRLLAALREL
jgi:selenocysteine lyase/cysteine desulfurase